MNSMTRSSSNVKPRLNVRGHAGSRTASTGSHDSGVAVQSPDVKDSHTRSRDSYYSVPQGHLASSQHAQYSSSYESRPQYNSGPRVFSNRTCVTPPSTDGAIHSLSDDSETVRFIADAWREVERELSKAAKEGIGGPDFYREKEKPVCNNLSEFVPFDLEGWHKRLNNRV